MAEQEHAEMFDLCYRKQLSFSIHEADIGFTDLITHDIPLLDVVPVRQKYTVGTSLLLHMRQ